MYVNGKKIDADAAFNYFMDKMGKEIPMEEDISNDDTFSPENKKSYKTRAEEFRQEIKDCNTVSNIPFRYKNSLFSDFDFGKCGKEVEKFALKPLDNVFLLFGGTGVGKTTLLCSTLHERAIKGLPAGYYFNNRLLMPILRTCRSFSAKENEESLYRRLSTYPFLCIDEVGASSNLKEEGEFLTNLLCARYDNEYPTFIATNLSPNNFKLLICGIDINSVSEPQKNELCRTLDKTNATLNRIKSIAKTYILVGESNRGVQNG